MNKVENLMLPLLKFMRIIGQGQLIPRQIAFLLQFNCQMDAHLLQSLDTFNHTLMNEIRRHYHEPEKYRYPSSDNMILYETMVMMMMMEDKNDDGGSDDDDDLYSVYLFIDLYLLCRYYWMHQGWVIQCRKYTVYVTTEPLEGLPVLLFLFLLIYQPKVLYKNNYIYTHLHTYLRK